MHHILFILFLAPWVLKLMNIWYSSLKASSVRLCKCGPMQINSLLPDPWEPQTKETDCFILFLRGHSGVFVCIYLLYYTFSVFDIEVLLCLHCQTSLEFIVMQFFGPKKSMYRLACMLAIACIDYFSNSIQILNKSFETLLASQLYQIDKRSY